MAFATASPSAFRRFAYVPLLVILAFWVELIVVSVPLSRSHDFLGFYAGGFLLTHGQATDLYDLGVQGSVERQMGSDYTMPFIRPPFYAALFAPLARLSLNAGSWVWAGVTTTVFLLCLIWGYKRFGWFALLLGVIDAAVPIGISQGQDPIILLALLIVCYELINRDLPFAAGSVLALTLFKFNLVLLWPVVLIVQRRWRILAGFGLVAAIEAILSFLLVGMPGLRSYASLLLDHHFGANRDAMISFTGFAANLGLQSVVWKAALVCLTLALFFLALRRASLEKTFSIATVSSLAIAPHAYAYDLAPFLLTSWFTLFCVRRRFARIMALLIATAIPFPLLYVGKPWKSIAAASLIVFLAALAPANDAPPESAKPSNE